MLEVGGHQDFCITLNGSCENMAVAVTPALAPHGTSRRFIPMNSCCD